ncbi:ATP-binding protein [Dechloromonas sp. XY25]|uniref:histidine kinase n=1 Tax=Dechloromonas hankyongensis TaxID=2908002 RepID=A0ABS9K6K2_9RHOO|nr:ATP-binding protein [Dechloromonas hankyongensis]MCG2578793.1 ATP-binding protein [Dechloromonas hankyongensis]
MGRLFWKLFLFIWLGQMAAVAGTGALFWAEHRGLLSAIEGERRPPLLPDERRGEGPPRPPPFSPDSPPFDDRPPPPRFRPGPPGQHLPLWPLFAGFVASLLCAGGVAWYFARPIRHLRSGFDAVSSGDLGARVMPGMGARRDELADLGRDFDHMADRLQAVVEGQKRLLHDVSHELRSPLARLQAAVGLARQQPERTEDTMARIERESERMNRLIGELLTLSRLEAKSAVELGPVDMDELMAGLVEDARFEGMGRHIDIDYAPTGMASVLANGELLHRAIENVVRNALRYAPTDSSVRIEAGVCASGVFRISVLDCGPGVADSDLATIFTPFFRGQAMAGHEGYGLGLAIARRVVESVNGTITATNRKNGGLAVCIEIPLSTT